MTRPGPSPRSDRGRPEDRWLSLSLPPDPLRAPGVILLPLRAFLGITFCFAGLQKLANKNFLNSASPASIQAQIIAYERTSPIHRLLAVLAHFGPLVGLGIAFAELAVGLGALLGLWTRLSALLGMAITFGLFLTVSFHSNPYYTGADIVWFFAWTPLLLAGSGGVWSLDAVIEAFVAHRVAGLRRAPDPEDVARRTVVLKGLTAGAVGAGALVFGGIVAAVGRAMGGPAARSTTTPNLGPGAGTSPSTTAAPAPTTTAASSGSKPAGVAIGPARDVPAGGAASFQDPGSGDPALVIQPARGEFVAFDAICPHAGCTVEYAASDGVLVCPCHGSQFSAKSGAVEVGPAQTGLRAIKIAEGSDGQLYVQS
ncbi:MAG TPA: Rieske 2Fe-2S domain-containing protein [Acidimicrobiales bacterium]|nr:Rieske 2Fe-2S domain-containing protein [Acidimicrobiales bacterium]